jgi:hypothetical protein
VTLALLLFLAASATFEESFRAGLLALQRNDLSCRPNQSGSCGEAFSQRRARLGRAGANVLEAESRRQGGRRGG